MIFSTKQFLKVSSMAANYIQCGTMITLVPYNNGVIVGADSRSNFPESTFVENYVDGASKLRRYERKEGRTLVYGIAGCAQVFVPGSLVTATSLAEYVKSCKLSFDAYSIVDAFLEKNEQALSMEFRDALRKHIADHVALYGTKQLYRQRLSVVMAEVSNNRGELRISLTSLTVRFGMHNTFVGTAFITNQLENESSYSVLSPSNPLNHGDLSVYGEQRLIEEILKGDLVYRQQLQLLQKHSLSEVDHEVAMKFTRAAFERVSGRVPTIGGQTTVEVIEG